MLAREFIVYEPSNTDLSGGKFGVLDQSNCPTHELIPRKVFRFPYNGFGGHLAGQLTYVNKIRAMRPNAGNVHQFLSLIESRDSTNVFEAIAKGFSPEILIAKGEVVETENLTTIEPSYQSLEDVLAATVINPFPGGFRCCDESVQKLMDEHSLINPDSYNHMISLISFVTRFPDLNKGFQQLAYTPVSHVSALLSTMKESIKESVKQLKSWGIKYINVMPVMNLGGYAGATQDGLHCHVHMDLTETGHDVKYDGFLRSAQDFDQSITDELRVCQNNAWSLYVVNAPERNYQLTIRPLSNAQQFQDLTKSELNGLARMLKLTDLALCEAGIAKHRNIAFRPLYEGYDCENFKFFVDIFPFELVGGLEIAGNMRIAKVNPYDAVEELRSIINEFTCTGYEYMDYEY